MAAAILQGVPVTTLDTDLWLDLPQRQYIRALNLCRRLGANILANTAVALSDDTLVNFVYRVTGLGRFAAEWRRVRFVRWHGMRLPVLPLASILKSRRAIMRPKDIAHLPLLRQTIALQKRLGRRSRQSSRAA